MPQKRNLSKTLSPQTVVTRSEVKLAAEMADPSRKQIAIRRGRPPKKSKVIDGNDQTVGSTGPSSAHQQQNVSELYQSLTKLELENRLLKAELKQREMMDEIKDLKEAKMEQQQKEKAFVGQIQELKDEQKKCLDKCEALEKELARKYICIGQFAKLLTRIDQMEAQINGPKQMQQGTSSSSMPIEKHISEHPNSTNDASESDDTQLVLGQLVLPQLNGHQMQIHVKAINGTVFTLKNVLPSTTIKQIMAKIEDIKHIPIKQQRLIFDGKQLEYGRTLEDYNIKNGDHMHLFLRLCGC
ncbi:hypothetical protein niasHT_009129 [Heterodera trifolii]|uniref:Ubiquitin-like domain-containing protein n=1 Tax=Heterodera trifolii TaxID=157864 RepID=A0ABD2M8Q7_9BILA